MQMKISPSLMCADIEKIKDTLETFEKNSIEYLHIDIMDGQFVPNFTLGTDYCKHIKRLCNIPLDIHLMIEKPEEKISW
ncbi:MAG: ribulose-phosphate 3-epimerase, partial [Clostridia bacterium]|nr:ribulose-phosphate 3-epimerase [Clostridia bacterium]